MAKEIKNGGMERFVFFIIHNDMCDYKFYTCMMGKCSWGFKSVPYINKVMYIIRLMFIWTTEFINFNERPGTYTVQYLKLPANSVYSFFRSIKISRDGVKSFNFFWFFFIAGFMW